MLQDDPQNIAALSGLAQCYLKSGDVARAEQTIGLVPPDKRNTASVASVRPRWNWHGWPPRPAIPPSWRRR